MLLIWATCLIVDYDCFENCLEPVFNQDIGGWDVSNVTNMTYMFSNADAFNQDIGGWDVSNVYSIQWMFAYNDSFNQDISNWEVDPDAWTDYTFWNATAFNQDLSAWCLSAEPYLFDAGASTWVLPRPTYGNCP